MTQMGMDLQKKPANTAMDLDEVFAKYPKLASLPRVGWRNKKAWHYKARAKKFLLNKDHHVYLVDQGGWAHCLCHAGSKTTQVVKLLDPDKRFAR